MLHHAAVPSPDIIDASATPPLQAHPYMEPDAMLCTPSAPLMSASPATSLMSPKQEAAAVSEAAGSETVASISAMVQSESGLSSALTGQDPNSNSPAGPAGAQHDGGVSSAAAGRERSEAARRGARNRLLLSLHRVAVTELAEYQDLPMGTGTEQLADGDFAETPDM